MLNDPREAVESFIKQAGASEAYALATVVWTRNATSAKPGAKAIITDDGELIGWVGSSCVQGAVRKVGQQVLKSGEAKMIRVKPKEDVSSSHDDDGVELHKSGCPSKGTSDIFIEAVVPRSQLVICGNSFVARSLAELGAAVGFDVVQAAPGIEAESEGRLRVVHDFEFTDIDRLEQSYWVVATQGARDRDALTAALAQDAPYVAFVGSGKKMVTLKKALLEAGNSAERLERLICPAGLDLGSVEPAEIAVSILAQVIQLRHAKSDKGSIDGSDTAKCA
jgi:xanthine dehydrogenase accessory factor